MSISENSWTLKGNIGGIKTGETKGKTAFLNFTLAETRGRKDEKGKWHNSTVWHDCTLYGKVALSANADPQFKVGALVRVKGRLDYNVVEYEDSSDVKYAYCNVNEFEVLQRPAKKQEAA